MKNKAEKKSINFRRCIFLIFFIISFYCINYKPWCYYNRYPSQWSPNKIVVVLWDQERYSGYNGTYPPKNNQKRKINAYYNQPLILSSKPLRHRTTFSQFVHLSYSKKSKSLYFLYEKVLSWLQRIRLNAMTIGFVICKCLTFTHIIMVLSLKLIISTFQLNPVRTQRCIYKSVLVLVIPFSSSI